jgi:hypothetical protein
MESADVTVPSPSGGWAPGPHAWALQRPDGAPIARGDFAVLPADTERLLARAQEELAGDAERLAGFYYALGLKERAREIVRRELSRANAEEGRRLRARFGLEGDR